MTPGAPVVPRLNRAEYDASVRDLFGTAKRPSEQFPVDESANGFDNQGAALTTTSLHVEAWEEAAVDLIDEMFGSDPEVTVTATVEAEGPFTTLTGEGTMYEGTAWIIRNGTMSANVTLVDDGLHEIVVRVTSHEVDGIEPRAVVRADDRLVKWLDVADTRGGWTEFTVQAYLSVGTHNIEIGLDNPGTLGNDARALAVDRFEVRGPIDPEGERTAAYTTWVGCETVDRPCASAAIARFGAAAWRRPLTEDDVAWALGLYDAAVADAETPEYALRLALRGILLSPDFLFRLTPAEDGEIRRLTSPELASRLAAFLWSSLPDQPLADLAAADGKFGDGTLDEQVERMLADPRADALVANLAGQWLSIRAMDEVMPAERIYPDWDEPLRSSMRAEMEMLAGDFFRSRISLLDLLSAESTWVDERLAEHYGLPWDASLTGWIEMPTAGTGRVGYLGTGGWLATQSHSESPSAVFRGKWVLDRLLCDAPPPPPPGVIADLSLSQTGGPVREQEEERRADPMCQGCHARIDGIGFVFGDFDGIGAWRAEDELGYPIDTSGDVKGVEVSDVPGLVAELLRDDAVPRCVVEQTLTYALGRPLGDEDDPVLDDLTATFVAGGLKFDALAGAIAKSDVFRFRGVESE